MPVYRYKTKTKGQLWEVRVKCGGKSIHQRGFPTKREAVAAQIAIQTRHGSSARSYLFRDYVKVWTQAHLESGTLRNTTKQAYIAIVKNHLLPAFGNKLLTEKMHSSVKTWLGTLESKRPGVKSHRLSNKTISHIKNILHLILESACADGLIDRNPVSHIRVSQKQSTVYMAMSLEDLRTVDLRLRGSSIYVPFLIAAVSGARMGEILGLKWSDIDWENHTISIERSVTYVNGTMCENSPKTFAGHRGLPLPRTLFATLDRFREELKATGVYPGNKGRVVVDPTTGKPLTTQQLSYRWKDHMTRICRDTGIEYRSFHTFRTTVATIMDQCISSPKAKAGFLGHTDWAFSLRQYVRYVPEMAEVVCAALEEMLGFLGEEDEADG